MSNGEYFKYKHFRSIEQDGVDIKGTNNAWVGFEELTEWTNLEVYKIAKATLRSVHKNAPNCIRSTTNPDGVGRLPVKDFFRLPENYNRLIELPLVGKRPKCNIKSVSNSTCKITQCSMMITSLS